MRQGKEDVNARPTKEQFLCDKVCCVWVVWQNGKFRKYYHGSIYNVKGQKYFLNGIIRLKI